MTFKLNDLPYGYQALEPYIDAKTMEIHYTKHHKGYCDKLNDAVSGTPYDNMKIEDILAKGEKELPAAIRNNGGGFHNHNLFWQMMSPKSGGEPKGDVANAIHKKFGDFAKFKTEFSEAAKTRFGSGWSRLVVNKGELEVMSTPNQDSPLMYAKTPLLGLDVWEHAYYLNYQNRRPDYVEAFWKIVKWDFVNELYKKAQA